VTTEVEAAEAVAQSQLEQSGNGASAAVPQAATTNGASGAEPVVGQVAEGVVSGITHFGAFVNLDGGATGLIHISEIAYSYVRDVREHLKLNDRVRVKVLQINPGNGKFDLSLKQTLEPPPEVALRWRRGRREKTLPEGADPMFEEKLSKFLKTSEERLLDLKRNIEAKRGGRTR
jgi:S1 RNA binding domain protein